MSEHAYLGREIVPLALEALPSGLVSLPPIKKTPEWVRISDPVDWATRFTRFAANRYGLSLTYFKVKFAELDGARVGEIQDYGSEFVIRVEPVFKDDAAALSHILAHEVAHVVLNRAGIALGPERANELLTDSVAVLAGFGELFLGRKLRVTLFGIKAIPIMTIGYLTQRQVRWLNGVRHRLGPGGPWPRGRVDRRKQDHMPCAICQTKLALPAIEATLDLTCPRCSLRQRVQVGAGRWLVPRLGTLARRSRRSSDRPAP